MPPYLAAEIRALGYTVEEEQEAGVSLRGSLNDAMKLNLHLRTAHRVLYLLDQFTARDADMLYTHVNRLPWETCLDPDGYFSVNASVQNETINDTRFPALRCKDAIVDRMREMTGRRPESGSEQDRLVVFLYWNGDEVRLYLDTSGQPLSRRGYRKRTVLAPMQETLAAGVVIATGWDGSCHLVNPMCGSGTIAIEAALAALNRPAGGLRDNFGFMHIKGYPRESWAALQREATRGQKTKLAVRILASDLDPKAVSAARENALAAGVQDSIEFSVCDFIHAAVPDGRMCVILNPEYGERMGETNELITTYRAIGDFFKKRCAGSMAYVFTGNMTLAKQVGLRSKRRLTFFNSQLECRLLEFELWDGTREPGHGPEASQRVSE